MQLKRYITYSLISALLLTSTACNKKLDVNPANSITPDQIKTSDDVQAVLFGAYNSLQHFNAYGERYKLMADLLGSNGQVRFTGTFTEYRDIFNKAQVSSSAVVSGIWGRSYIIISSVNTVLDKLALVDASIKDETEGEAKFIRGSAYFELANFFGLPYSAGNQTVNETAPLILEPVTSYDATRDNKPRAKVSEIYAQVISDLTDAVAKLPEENVNGRATKYSALAILSRVYLAQQKYTEAATAANEVIASNKYELTSTFDKAFNNTVNSSEDIFGIQQTDQSNAGTTNNGMVTFYALAPIGRGDVKVDPAELTQYEDNDDRKAFVYTDDNGAYYTSKWSALYKTIPVVRLAEMYLTRAEANARSGAAQIGNATPLQDVNTVRERSQATPLTTVTADQIVQERFRELAFEGDWLWTKKRLKMNVGTKAYTDNYLVLPVPQRERDVNKQLTQNPGYDQ